MLYLPEGVNTIPRQVQLLQFIKFIKSIPDQLNLITGQIQVLQQNQCLQALYNLKIINKRDLLNLDLISI